MDQIRGIMTSRVAALYVADRVAPVPRVERDGSRSEVAPLRRTDAADTSGSGLARLASDEADGSAGLAYTAKVDHGVYGSDHRCPYC
jgi:hypothetical protein